MNADPFSITSKIPRALHEGYVDPYKIRYVSILPRIHAPSIYIPSSPTPAWIHGDPCQNNPRSLHGGAWIYIGSYTDLFHVPSVSDPFWHYLPPPVGRAVQGAGLRHQSLRGRGFESHSLQFFFFFLTNFNSVATSF
uniref:Uncharacterized protein n=1 Tax=Caenorhabditis japonica TaxID=281687 RepID=A0A8R1IPI7_CAEJA